MGTFRVVGVKKDGKAYLVMLRKGQLSRMFSVFTVWRALAQDESGELTARQAAAAVKWVKKKGWRARLVRNPYPFIVKADGVTLPGDKALLRKLNRVGREMKRLVLVKSGYRDNYQQWQCYMTYCDGGNLAARCCRNFGDKVKHSWAQCGKRSESNHSQPPKGHAVDCGLVMSWGYTSIGNVDNARRLLRRFGACLPVGGEPWHVEIGDTFRA